MFRRSTFTTNHASCMHVAVDSRRLSPSPNAYTILPTVVQLYNYTTCLSLPLNHHPKMRGDVVGRDYVAEIMQRKKKIEPGKHHDHPPPPTTAHPPPTTHHPSPPVLKSRGRSLIVGAVEEKESVGKVLRRRLMVPVNVMKGESVGGEDEGGGRG